MDTFLIPLFIIACIFFFCEFIALLLYAIPVRFALLLVQKEGQREHSVSVSWGLIGFRITGRSDQRRIETCIGSHVIHSRKLKGEPQMGDDAKIPAPADLRSVEQYLTLLSQMIVPAGRFVSVLWQECRFENCTGSIRIGTKDPVATGILYGGYWAARFGFMASRIIIDMKPEFNREIFEMDMTIRLRISHPLRIIVAGIYLMKNRAVRQSFNSGKPRARGAIKV